MCNNIDHKQDYFTVSLLIMISQEEGKKIVLITERFMKGMKIPSRKVQDTTVFPR
jgi:hypothetical protein